jgi:plasmid stabilization system protein ParE
MPDDYRILMSQRVAAQLESIFDNIVHDSPPHASKLIQEILAGIELLKLFPMRQVVRHQPRADYPIRSLPVGNYMVFFEVHEKTHAVKLLRVSHAARKRPRRFR